MEVVDVRTRCALVLRLTTFTGVSLTLLTPFRWRSFSSPDAGTHRSAFLVSMLSVWLLELLSCSVYDPVANMSLILHVGGQSLRAAGNCDPPPRPQIAFLCPKDLSELQSWPVTTCLLLEGPKFYLKVSCTSSAGALAQTEPLCPSVALQGSLAPPSSSWGLEKPVSHRVKLCSIITGIQGRGSLGGPGPFALGGKIRNHAMCKVTKNYE